MACLKPGGIAVHTTEFNLGSNSRTLQTRATVAYRKQDIEQLALMLLQAGHSIPTINLSPGSEPLDRVIDLPPFKAPVHLKVLCRRHLLTSIGLYAIRG
jgi:hypothetical protein